MFLEIIGWVASALILAAYILVSSKKTKGDSVLYQGLNLVGAILWIIYTIYKSAYPGTFLNIIWGLIAIKILLSRNSKH